MFGKIGPAKKNTFEQEIASEQRQKLKENLEKLAVPRCEQDKIIEMRNNSSDEYRKSRCFWFLENHTIPETKTKLNRHHFETFERCQRDLSKALEHGTEEPHSEGLKFR
ncbi:hypothetical protein [Legionella sp. WA2022007384]